MLFLCFFFFFWGGGGCAGIGRVGFFVCFLCVWFVGVFCGSFVFCLCVVLGWFFFSIFGCFFFCFFLGRLIDSLLHIPLTFDVFMFDLEYPLKSTLFL